MKPETIQVTINPDGTCKEVNQLPKCECVPLTQQFEECPHINRSATNCRQYQAYHDKEQKLRTFEIELEKCTCNNFWEKINCEEICKSYRIEAGETHTAEILPNNKVKILS